MRFSLLLFGLGALLTANTSLRRTSSHDAPGEQSRASLHFSTCNFYLSNCWGNVLNTAHPPSVLLSMILHLLVSLLLPSSFSQPPQDDDWQISEAEIVLVTDRLQGCNSRGGKWETEARFGVIVSSSGLKSKQRQVPCRSSSVLVFSALPVYNSPLK